MGDNKVCSIICGAPCEVDKRLVEGFVIAADSGLDRCKAAGITPNLAVGDFDSAVSKIPDGTERVTVPSEKDITDAWLAARIALERSYSELRFFCALGGRMSHSLANVQMLRDLKQKGAVGVLFGERSAVFLLEGKSVRIPRFEGYLSLFALDEAAQVSEAGVKYPLDRHMLTNTFPLGVSNEIIADTAEITVHSGLCIVVLESN